MYPGGDICMYVLLVVSWTYTVQATCPDYNGETPIAREHISDGTWTGVHVGNPITCNGFVTGWRFFPTRAVEFIALVMRPHVAANHQYTVVGRTIIPAQQVLNQIREFTLQESDWIPVRSGDSIGIKFDASPIPYSYSGTAFLFTSSISKHELLFGTIHTIDQLYMETYSFQAVLKDSNLPCHIINWPLMKTTTDIATASRIWMDDWNKIKCPGTITGWRFIAGGPGDIIALVYRAVDADNNIYEVVSKTMIPSPAERDVVTEFKLSYSQQISVVPGDKIGLTYTDSVLYVLRVYSKVESIYKFTDIPDDVEIGTEITFTSYDTCRFMFDAVLDVEKPDDVHRSTVIANDHKLQNNIIESTTSKSMGTCVIKCVENEQCKSVNYNQNHMTCELNDATREEDNGNFVAEDGERYIETSRLITNVAGRCALVDCGPGNVCVEIFGIVRQHLCLCSPTAYLAEHCPSAECLRPLGMESGNIVDEQLSASSSWNGADDHSAKRGRLNLSPLAGSYVGAWCVGAGASDLIHSWIQIDLLVEHNVTGIITQGREDDYHVQWVRIYTISYIKVYEMGETYITDGYRYPKVFDGNWDQESIRVHYFNPVIPAVIIRIHPKDWQGHPCLRTEVLGCRIGQEWVRAFKGISMTGLSIYDAWNTGAGASSYHADKFLISNKHYRNNAILNNWSSFGIEKVKLTLFSPTNEEMVSVIFNGVNTTSTSWFTRDKIESSPWEDIKTAPSNVFSLPGAYSRRFYMSSSHSGCDTDSGWFTVEESTQCPNWDGYSSDPRIIYSKAASKQSWFLGDIGSARAMVIDVKIG